MWQTTKIPPKALSAIRRALGKIDGSTGRFQQMTDRPIRASDLERESVVDVLRDAFTDGRLSLD